MYEKIHEENVFKINFMFAHQISAKLFHIKKHFFFQKWIDSLQETHIRQRISYNVYFSYFLGI